MRWKGRRQSENVEDRRGMPVSRGAAVGGLGTLIIIVLGLLLGVNPMALLQQMPQQAPVAAPGQEGAEAGFDDETREFVSVVLADTEEVWTELFERELNRRYEKPTLELFTGATNTACGLGQSAMGPFYCPADKKVYLDASFFEELDRRFGAPGDFAQAYVIAHEVGHHVQNLVGLSEKVQRAQQRVGKAEANDLSVRLELQADYLAGVWAHHAQQNWQILEPGDIEEALNAANAIGDDTLQRQAGGRVVPDSFTHGSSEQRIRWFTNGLKSGELNLNNTFETDRL